MTAKYKRRTFKDVEQAAYFKGWAEGREAALKDAKAEYAALEKDCADLGRMLMEAEAKLRNVSLRKLAWSRITGLFGEKP